MKKWMLPCNLNKYDIVGSFIKNGFVDYGTNLNISEGDTVFIYASAPYSAIILACRVRAVLSLDETINDSEFVIGEESFKEKSKYIRLIAVKNYLNKIDLVNHIKLQENGVKGFNFQIELSERVAKYLDNI